MARGGRTALICCLLGGLAGAARADAPASAMMGADVPTPRASLAFGHAEITLTLVRQGARQLTSPVVSDVEIQGEVTSDASARELGYRSMVAVADVDCDARRDRVLQFDGYDGGGLTGSLRAVVPSDAWEIPSGAQAGRILDAVCKGAPSHTPAAAPLVAAAVSDTPPAARAAPREQSKPTAGKGRGAVVQLGSYPTDASARARLRQLGVLPTGLATEVAVALVQGATHYRAIVSGFGDAAEASAFCAARRLPAAGCWIH